jgi:hypothetical protein
MSVVGRLCCKTILRIRARKIDSKIYSLRFDSCVFLFYRFSAVTFATQSARLRHSKIAHGLPLSEEERSCSGQNLTRTGPNRVKCGHRLFFSSFDPSS